MKIFNFGSDYAYQQKQRHTVNDAKPSMDEETTVNPIHNVGDQIQTGGEGKVNTAPETEKTLKSKSKKKKESREETKENYQADCQIS